MVGAMSA